MSPSSIPETPIYRNAFVLSFVVVLLVFKIALFLIHHLSAFHKFAFIFLLFQFI